MVLAVMALLAPPSASAHVRSGAVAVDYRARVFAFPAPLRRVIAVRIYESDRGIRLTVAPGHSAVVLGYLHDPFVRVATEGVEVNASAPTAGGSGLMARLPLHSVGWRLLTRGRSVTWHDNRVRALPSEIDRAQWKIPLLVDGRATSLHGELWRVGSPPWWPGIVVGLPFALVSLLLFSRRRSAVSTAAALFGLLAAAGLTALGAGFAFDTYTTAGKWVELGNEFALAVAGVAVIAFGTPVARGIAGGLLGVLGLAIGALSLPILQHGVVLAVLPAAAARMVLVLTMWSAAAAAGLGLVVFEDELAVRERSLGPSRLS